MEWPWTTISAAVPAKRRKDWSGRYGEKKRFLGPLSTKRRSSSRRTASFLRARQLTLNHPEIQLSRVRRTNSEVSPAPGILDALHVFVGEIKKALGRTLITDLAGKPPALLHLRKHLKL